MLDHFIAGINKCFNNASTLLKSVEFIIVVSEDYDPVEDSTFYRTEKTNINCLVFEKETSSKPDGLKNKKEITLVAKVSDFKKIPTVNDYFFYYQSKFNIESITNDNGIYLNIRGV